MISGTVLCGVRKVWPLGSTLKLYHSILTPPPTCGNSGQSTEKYRELTPKSRKCLKPCLLSPPSRQLLSKRRTSPTLSSPIFKKKPEESTSDFMTELLGTVFRTPERTTFPAQHFENSTPDHARISDDAKLMSGTLRSAAGTSDNVTNESPTRGFLPSIFGSYQGDSTALNASFSKLLDLSGISLFGNTGNISASQFTDLADISWSNLGNI